MRLPSRMLPAALVAAGLSGFASAETLTAVPGQPLQALLDRAHDGDVIELAPGEYNGSIRIDRPLVLTGRPGAVLDGGGAGNVVTVTAPDVTVRGVTVRGSGRDLQAMNSGIFLAEDRRARDDREQPPGWKPVRRLRARRRGIARRPQRDRRASQAVASARPATAFRSGMRPMSPSRTTLSATAATASSPFPAARTASSATASSRFVSRSTTCTPTTAKSAATFRSATMSATPSCIRTGWSIRDNISDRDRDHGMLFNYANYAEIDGNRVTGGALDPVASKAEEGPDDERGHDSEPQGRQHGLRSGPEKCVFIYNTNHNKFRNNWFEGCDIGVHFTAGSEGNEITGNAFVGNRNQVKYVGTRDLDWSRGGRGNYWSDNPAFDLNGDGIADTAYRPNDLVDRVLWTAPSAKVLINSPAVQVLRWAQAQFPALCRAAWSTATR